MTSYRTVLGLCSAMLCAVLGATALFGEARAESATLRIGGNGSALSAMRLLAKGYMETHPELTITVVPNLGSSGGIAALRQGALDLAISARALKPEELRAGLAATEYARSPFVFAVHGQVAPTGLTSAELARLYLQDDAQWPDGTRVRLVLRPKADADTALVQQISPEVQRAVQHAHTRPGMVIAVTDQDSLDAIAKMPGALGGATLTEIVTEQRPVRMLSFNGVKPTLKNLSDASYPLAKHFYLVSARSTSPQARQFAEFIRSAKGREILAKAGNLVPHDGKGR